MITKSCCCKINRITKTKSQSNNFMRIVPHDKEIFNLPTPSLTVSFVVVVVVVCFVLFCLFCFVFFATGRALSDGGHLESPRLAAPAILGPIRH